MTDYQEKAFAAIKSRRLTAERNYEIFMAKLRQDNEFSMLENAKDSLYFKIAEYKAKNKPLGNMISEYESLKSRFIAKLASMNLTEADLAPKYSCTICNDTGLVDRQICNCVKQLTYDNIKSTSEALPKDAPMSFDEIKFDIYGEESAGYKKLFKFLSGYAASVPHAKYDILFLHGAVGTGKTYAAAVTANATMRAGSTALFINAQQLTSLFLKYHSAPINEKFGIFRPLAEADLLVLDDLGSEPLYNNVTIPYLYQLLGERMGMSTIITSNLTIKDVEVRYGQRIGSRLADTSGTFAINLSGKDLRLKK